MRRAILLAALSALPFVHAPAADAYWSSGCEFGGTITFSPPLGTQPWHGTWSMSGTAFCGGAVWSTTGVFPATDTWQATNSGIYTGNCVEATLTDGYTVQFSVAGGAVAGYLIDPWYGATAGAMTPAVGSCPGGLRVGNITTVGVGTARLL